MATSVFAHLRDQFDWFFPAMGGKGIRIAMPLDRIEIACEALGFGLNESLLDLVQHVSSWYMVLMAGESREPDEGGGMRNAAWVN